MRTYPIQPFATEWNRNLFILKKMSKISESADQIRQLLCTFMSQERSQEWIIQNLFRDRQVYCSNCRILMNLISATTKTPFYRCKKCRKEVSILHNTSLYRSKLKISSLLTLLLLIYIQSSQFSIQCITGIERHSIGYYQSLCRVALMEELQKHPIYLGGEGKTVQIDEAVLRRRKYNRGAIKPTIWIFGMVEVEAAGFSKILLTRVEDRTRWSLIPVICKHVLRGTTIVSDEWSAYKTLDIMSDYHRISVNHSKTFKDPETGACTNKIEGAWAHLRRSFPSTGIRERFIEDYLASFIMSNKRILTFIDFAKVIVFYIKTHDETEDKKEIKEEEDVLSHMTEAEAEIYAELHQTCNSASSSSSSTASTADIQDSSVDSGEMDDIPVLGEVDSDDSLDPYGAGTGEDASEYSDD